MGVDVYSHSLHFGVDKLCLRALGNKNDNGGVRRFEARVALRGPGQISLNIKTMKLTIASISGESG